MKKYLLAAGSALLAFFSGAAAAAASTSYTMLQPLPTISDGGGVTNFTTYITKGFEFSIAIAAGLAVIMIIWGGFDYILTDSISGKSAGKKKITNAIIGLLLALGSYAILNTINPCLLKFDENILPPIGTKSTVCDPVSAVKINAYNGFVAQNPNLVSYPYFREIQSPNLKYGAARNPDGSVTSFINGQPVGLATPGPGAGNITSPTAFPNPNGGEGYAYIPGLVSLNDLKNDPKFSEGRRAGYSYNGKSINENMIVVTPTDGAGHITGPSETFFYNPTLFTKPLKY